MTVGITEPVPAPLQRSLRRAVLELARSERRRRFPPALRVGVPGGDRAAFSPAADAADHALRVEVVQAMVHRLDRALGPPLVWLTRPGPLDPEDVDLWWLAAVRAAVGELGLDARFVTVSRMAWRDPVTGVGREWPRPPRVRR